MTDSQRYELDELLRQRIHIEKPEKVVTNTMPVFTLDEFIMLKVAISEFIEKITPEQTKGEKL